MPTGIVPIRPTKQLPAAAPDHVVYHGGPVIASVEVAVICWGSFWAQAGSTGGAQVPPRP